MPQRMQRHWAAVAIVAGALMLSATDCLAQKIYQATPEREGSLKKFLQGYLSDRVTGDDQTTEYSAAFVDLQDNGGWAAIVYITGRSWCGSGGCTILILACTDSSYEVLRKIAIARPPISVLAVKSHGWHDLSVHVQGGGVLSGREARISFDGRRYTRNPSMLPAGKPAEMAQGKVVIAPTAARERLYP